MSSSLPPEIVDLVIDQLRDEPATLRACCLVSKSWIPRARSHLFAHVKFIAQKTPITSWIETFPDPSNSPAHHTRSLTIQRLPAFITTGVDVGSWIRTFQNVVDLRFEHITWPDHQAPLAPFHGFSHTVRSLRLTYTSFEVFDLVCSFPLLEDLALVGLRPKDDIVGLKSPSTSPKLTGSLNISTNVGTRSAIRRLLDFPNGLHFTKIALTCLGGDFGAAADLVSRCSGSLESLDIRCFLSGASPSASLVG